VKYTDQNKYSSIFLQQQVQHSQAEGGRFVVNRGQVEDFVHNRYLLNLHTPKSRMGVNQPNACKTHTGLCKNYMLATCHAVQWQPALHLVFCPAPRAHCPALRPSTHLGHSTKRRSCSCGTSLRTSTACCACQGVRTWSAAAAGRSRVSIGNSLQCSMPPEAEKSRAVKAWERWE
jgi:hypothetical protein